MALKAIYVTESRYNILANQNAKLGGQEGGGAWRILAQPWRFLGTADFLQGTWPLALSALPNCNRFVPFRRRRHKAPMIGSWESAVVAVPYRRQSWHETA